MFQNERWEFIGENYEKNPIACAKLPAHLGGQGKYNASLQPRAHRYFPCHIMGFFSIRQNMNSNTLKHSKARTNEEYNPLQYYYTKALLFMLYYLTCRTLFTIFSIESSKFVVPSEGGFFNKNSSPSSRGGSLDGKFNAQASSKHRAGRYCSSYFNW